MQLSRTNNKINIPKTLLLALLLITLGIYYFTPTKGVVSMSLFYTCFILMLLSNYIYFNAKKKINYLDFDTIFIVTYCLVGFSTTFLYHNYGLFRSAFLGFPVDEKYINKGNLLFLIGLQSYMIGGLVSVKVKKLTREPFIIKTKFLIVLVFVLMISFIAFGGINYYRSEYNSNVSADGGTIVKYILLLLVTTAMALIGTEFYNKKINKGYKIDRFAFIALFFLISTLLVIGNRTAASQILLPIICLYALFYKNINFKKFILFVLSGIVFMWVIQQTRTGRGSLKLTNPIMLILDLTIPMRNTYTALQYVDTHDYTYGNSMVLDASGAIPFLPSSIQQSFPELKPGSAALLTDYTFLSNKTPKKFQIGLGTTIIADIYLAFGLFGVLFLMYYLGRFINKYTIQSLSLNYYSIIVLCGMLGNAVFMVRAGYLHPLRFVVWALGLAYFNRFLSMAWKR